MTSARCPTFVAGFMVVSCGPNVCTPCFFPRPSSAHGAHVHLPPSEPRHLAPNESMPAVHSEDPFVTYGGYTIKTARLSAKTTTRRISMTMKKLRWSLRCIDALTPLFFSSAIHGARDLHGLKKCRRTTDDGPCHDCIDRGLHEGCSEEIPSFDPRRSWSRRRRGLRLGGMGFKA